MIPREDQGPTPETKRKLKPDLIDVLVRNGELALSHQAAAEDLHNLWYSLHCGMWPSPSWDGVKASGGRRSLRCVEGLSRRQYRLWALVFTPWNRALGRRVSLVYGAVWDNSMDITRANVNDLRRALQLFVKLKESNFRV